MSTFIRGWPLQYPNFYEYFLRTAAEKQCSLGIQNHSEIIEIIYYKLQSQHIIIFNMTNNVRLAYFFSQTDITFVILKSLLDHIEGLMKI